MTYFISGHRDLTWEEFAKWYAPLIGTIYHTDQKARFVLAECAGCDSMAQDYLLSIGVLTDNVKVYHMFENPRYLASPQFKTEGGYTSDIERDTAMTNDSDCDIAFIRIGKEKSGTAQNILRRWTKK